MDSPPQLPLPTGIIILILSWLPAESALRFKSVCRLWYQLITSDSIFIQAHLRRSSPQLIIQNPPGSSCLIRNPEGIFTVNLDLISKTKRRERSLGITYQGTRNSYTSLLLDDFDEYSRPANLNGALHWPSTNGPHIKNNLNGALQDPSPYRDGRVLTIDEICDMEIWTLKDCYNLSEKSWEMKYVISGETLGIRVRGVCFLDGEIVFTHLSDGLAYYNPTLNTLRKVPHRRQEDWFNEPSWTSVYQESLVSLLNLDRSSRNRTISAVCFREFHGEAPVNFANGPVLVERTD